MSFRSRVAALVALAVAGAFLLASLAMFASTRRSLLAAVDAELREAVREQVDRPGGPTGLAGLREFVENRRDRAGPAVSVPRGPAGDALRGLGVVQVVSPRGLVVLTLPEGSDPLPLTEEVDEVAGRGTTSDIHTVRTEESAYRVVAAPLGQGGVVQLARPIDDIEEGLRRMVAQLALVSLLGIGLAFVAGRVVADRILAPVRRLTATAELIAETQELAHRADEAGDDELARLAASLNRMLTALDASRVAQQQLIADASHELRTPLTSLRTNVEMLASEASLNADDRAAMRADVLGQIEEMTLLIGNLVDLARDGSTPARVEDVRLDELVTDVVRRHERLSPEVDFVLEVEPSSVRGDVDQLARAIGNLVDNAVKYAGDAGPIEVSVVAGEVRVRDHGPGVAPGDRAHVFDRFWRAPSARSAAGSGLGLAIVARAAAMHGGSVTVTDAAGGGAVFTLFLPS